MMELAYNALLLGGTVAVFYLVYKIVTIVCIISNALEDEYRDFSNSEKDSKGE